MLFRFPVRSVLFLVVLSVSASAQSVWNGNFGDSWDEPNNWTPSGVPTSTDDVTIPNVTTQPASFDVDPECDDLSIAVGASLTLGSGFELTVNGNLLIDGTLDVTSSSSDVTVAGNWTNNGTFNDGGAEVIFDGTGSLGGSGTTTFNNLTVDSGTRTASRAFVVDGAVTVSASSTLNLGTFTHSVAGNWASSASGATVSGTGTINFTDNGLITTQSNTVPNVLVSAGTREFNNVGIAGDLDMTGGAINVRDNRTVTVTGDVDLSGGTLGFTSTFAGAEVLDVAGNATITATAGSFSDTVEIRVAGDWSSTSAFAPTAGEVELDGSGQTLAGASPTFHDLTITSGTVTASSATDVDGDLTVAGGATLDADAAFDVEGAVNVGATGGWDIGSSTHTVAGDLVSTGAAITGAGSITLDGAGSLSSGLAALPDLTITAGARSASSCLISGTLDMTGGSLDVQDNASVLVSGAINLSAGTLNFTDTTAGAEVIFCTDDVTLTCTAGTMSANSTILCEGQWSSTAAWSPSDGVVNLNTAAADIVGSPVFHDLEIEDAVTKTATVAVTVNGDLDLLAGSTLDADAALDVNGDVTLASGTTLDLGTSTHTVAGSYTSSGGSATGTGVLDFDGTGDVATGGGTLANMTISAGTRSVSDTFVLGDVLMTGAGAVLEIQDNQALIVGGDCTLSAGTLAFENVAAGFESIDCAGNVTIAAAAGASSANSRIFCAGDWSSDAAFAMGAGTVFLDGGSSATVGGTGTSVPNLSINSGIKTVNTALAVNGDLTILDAAVLDTAAVVTVAGDVSLGNALSGWVMGGLTHSVGGDFTTAGGTASGVGSVVSFTGTGALSTGAGSIEAVTVTSGALTVSDSTITADLTVAGGSLTIVDDQTLTVGGDATFSSGSFDITGAGGAAETLDVEGAVTFSGATVGALTAESEILCGGNWSADANFAPAVGQVILDGVATTTVSGASLTFAGLQVTNGGTRTVSTPAQVTGDLAIDVGSTLDADAALDVDGNVILASTATFDLGSDTHTVAGGWASSGGDATGTTGLVDFDGPGLVSTGGGSVLNVRVSAGLREVSNTLVSNDLTMTGGELEILNNQFILVQGNVDLSGGTLSFNDTTPGREILIATGDASLTCTAGTMNANSRVRCGGNWTSTSAWTPTAGDVHMEGAGTGTLGGTNPVFFDFEVVEGTRQVLVPIQVDNDLLVDDACILDADAAVSVAGNATIESTGTWDLGILTHSVAGDYTSSGGSATGTTGAIDFTATGTTSSPTGTILNAIVSGGSRLMDDAVITGDLTLTGGTIRIDNNAVVNVQGNADLQAAGTISWHTIAAGADDVLDIDGNANVLCAAGTTTDRSVLRVGGSWTGSSAFAPADGRVELDGGTTVAVSSPGGLLLHDLEILSGVKTVSDATTLSGDLDVLSGASLDADAAFAVAGNVTLGDGTASWDLGGLTHTIAGDYVSSGADATGLGSMLDLTATGTFGTGGGTVPSVTVSGGTRQANSATVLDDLDVDAGVLEILADQTVAVGGDLTVALGASLAFSSTEGAGDETLDVDGSVTISGSSGATTDNSMIFCGGAWLSDSTWAPASGTVTLDGGTTTGIGGSSPTFASLRVASGDKTANEALIISGDLTVDDGAAFTTTAAIDVDGAVSLGDATASWTLGAFTHTVEGDFTSLGADATDGGGVGRIEFDGFGGTSTGGGSITNVLHSSGARGFFDAVIDGDLEQTGGILRIEDNALVTVGGNASHTGGSFGFFPTADGTDDVMDVEGDMTLTANHLSTSSDALLRVAGNWTSDSSFSPAAGTVELDGAVQTSIAGADPAFSVLKVTNGQVREIANDMTLGATVITIDPAATLGVADKDVLLPSTSVSVNGTLSLDAGSSFALGPGSAITVLGTLSMVGSPTDPAVMTGDSGGGYICNILGTLEAGNFRFEEMGPTGIVIAQTATLGSFPNDLRGGVFDLPSSSPGSVLLDIQRPGATEVRYVDFEDTLAVGSFNVRSFSGATVTFVNSGGSFSGDAFEQDPFGLLDWTTDTTDYSVLKATAGLDMVTVDWTTLSEADVSSFVLGRSTSPSGPFSTLVTEPAVGPTTYQYLDAAVVAGTTYYYELREVLTHGAEIVADVLSATPWDATLPANMITVGPGGTHATIQDAVNATTGVFNPHILIEAGSYDGFTVSGAFLGTLRIYPDGSGPVTISTVSGPVQVLGLTSAQSLEMSDFDIGSAISGNAGVVVLNCDGIVILDELTVTGDVAQPGIRVNNSDKVAIQRTDMVGAPGLILQSTALAVASKGSVDDVELTGTSDLRLCEMTLGGQTVEVGSSLEILTGVMPDIDMPELAPLNTPFLVDNEGEPFGTWFLILSFGLKWNDLPGAKWEMVGVADIDPPLGLVLLSLPVPGTGAFSFPLTLPADGSIIGIPVLFQTVVVHPSTGKRRWSNVVSVTGTP